MAALRLPSSGLLGIVVAAATLGLVAAPGLAAAQSFEIGVKGGVCLATLPGLEDTSGDYFRVDGSYGASVALGGSFAFGLTDWLALQPEVLYVQKAHDERITGGDPFDPFPIDFEGRARLNYLELPVLLRMKIGDRGLHLLAGPTLNVSLDCRDCVEPLDVGLAIGAGFYGRTLTLEARYEEGLRDTGRPTIDATGDAIRNRAFLFLVGVRRR